MSSQEIRKKKRRVYKAKKKALPANLMRSVKDYALTGRLNDGSDISDIFNELKANRDRLKLLVVNLEAVSPMSPLTTRAIVDYHKVLLEICKFYVQHSGDMVVNINQDDSNTREFSEIYTEKEGRLVSLS